MSLIAVIQNQMSERDKRIESGTILEGISLASVLPGPMAVNVVSFIGYKLNGIKGALLSMMAILLPSFLLMLLLSHFYLLYGNVPAFDHFFAAVLPAVAAIIVSVAVGMSKKSIRDIPQVAIAVLAAITVLFSKSYFTTTGLIIASGMAGYFIYNRHSVQGKKISTRPGTANKKYRKYLFIIVSILAVVVLLFVFPVFFPGSASDKATLLKNIVLTFSGISISQFGGGYVVIPAMQKIIVDNWHWLSAKEFADAIAMGQVTPGPIFISATFIGYKLAGFWGAFIATIAIFLPASLAMIFCTKFMERTKNAPAVIAAFKAISPAVIGMIFSSAITIMKTSDGNVFISLAIFLAVLGIIIKFKVNPVYAIPVAGIAGLFIF